VGINTVKNSLITTIFFLFFYFLFIGIFYSKAFSKENLSQYSKCIKDFGTLNTAAVHKCSYEVSEYLKLKIEIKIREIEKSDINNDVDKFLRSHDHWLKYMELQCEIQTKYIGSPMLHYCPMTKLEKRLKELEMLLYEVSN